MRLRSRPTRRFLLTTLGIGLIGGTLYNVALTEGTSMTSASNASLIMATSTVWGMLLAAGLGVEPLRATNVIGAVVSLVGVVIILGRGLEGAARVWWGISWSLPPRSVSRPTSYSPEPSTLTTRP
jgi:drug/metabolite transporter (DMT)-like permease